MADDRTAALKRSSTLLKLARETARLARQFAGLAEWTYRKAFLGVETTTVGVG